MLKYNLTLQEKPSKEYNFFLNHGSVFQNIPILTIISISPAGYSLNTGQQTMTSYNSKLPLIQFNFVLLSGALGLREPIQGAVKEAS